MAGHDLGEIYVLTNLHKKKMTENERSEKRITNDREEEKVSPSACSCWNFKKIRSNSSAQSNLSKESLQHQTSDNLAMKEKKEVC
ncbi:hypothetical protein L6452_04948 [Arctium lappa]|uniref:Uncharacterized protein n=1 Tax=Arctium lappa TaxID=4217 RepID=A0ACB9EF62_ARCLA|nr:hypothetical protein L6452_04948 [Arctium lappa]